MIVRHDTRVVYQNKWMTVREDSVEFPNGTRGIYGVVDKPDFAAIVPVDADGRIHLVQQYRYPVGGRFWEIPQGTWEEKPDATPEDVALTELREEAGLCAGRLTRIGHLYEAYGYSSQGCHLFVATELEQHTADLSDTETDLIAQSFSVAEIRALIRDGQIKDATTIAAFGHLMLSPEFSPLFSG